jgi:hypothetical protein
VATASPATASQPSSATIQLLTGSGSTTTSTGIWEETHFGFSARRIGDLYCGMVKDAAKNHEWKKKYRKTAHDHHPVNDALANAEAILAMKALGLNIKLVGHRKKANPERWPCKCQGESCFTRQPFLIRTTRCQQQW